ncbi:class I SAM-dependent methyltransferase [Thermoproteota archaeon]
MEAKDWDKISKEYHEYIISPFQKGVVNPLFRKLKSIKSRQDKVIADIGCGRGEIGDKLGGLFKEVHLIDFSPAMIDIAKKQNKAKNIKYHIADIRELSKFNNMFDAVIAVNSVIMPSIADLKKAFSSIHATLKQDGVFFGIFPSMESITYQAFLILEQQVDRFDDEEKAVTNAKRLLERGKYSFVKGVYEDQGEAQKFYYDFELKIRLQDAGFKKVRISKVLYPWGRATGDFKDFPGRPKMWDWFVSAVK